MFERFTPEARQVVVVAHDEVRRLRHGSIGPEHLLLALTREQQGIAARALGDLGLTPDRVREEIHRRVRPGTQTVHGQIPFTPSMKRVFDQALRHAMSMGHDQVSTGHLLLGLASERDGTVGQVLASGGGDPSAVHDAVLRAMDEPVLDEPADEPEAADVPGAVAIPVGDDVRRVLRRAAGLALADDAREIGVDHVHRAIHDAMT